MRLCVAGLFFALLTTPALASDFEDGLRFSINGDYASAAASFQKAAKLGEQEAQFNLALMYEEGRGVTQDYPQAAFWYLKAADQGYTLAQLRLGEMLFKGKGIKQDKVEAYKWLNITSENNKRGAKKETLAEMASLMTQPQIEEAQLRKNAWLKAHQTKNQMTE